MKGPSLDAIKKFKEQQEKKKKEEEEKKLKEKLSILEFRASKGDRKAKQELKRYESSKQEQNKGSESSNNIEKKSNKHKIGQVANKSNTPETASSSKQLVKPKKVETTNFEELMRLAKQNEIKNSLPKIVQPEKTVLPELKKKVDHLQRTKEKLEARKLAAIIRDNKSKIQNEKLKSIKQEHSSNNKLPNVKQSNKFVAPTTSSKTGPIMNKTIVNNRPNHVYNQPVRPKMMGPIYSRSHDYYDDDDDDDDDDNYEADDFVVDDEEDDAQDELRKTLKTVFRYDKRRCDLREEELDRHYRAIGRVSTFEDLEREERRASRLAAEEDARALREEEDRKRFKKMRLKNNL